MRFTTLVALALMAAPAVSLAADGNDPALRPIDPYDDPSYHAPADVPGLPRVLLLGDSISIDYTLPVRRILIGVANVRRPAENCGPTELGLAHLDGWLAGCHWDVIHFNFGLHDLKHVDDKGSVVASSIGRQLSSLATYETNLRLIVGKLKETGARLIFATTTPVPAGAGSRVKGDERQYNEVALRVMKEQGVAIDDLWSVVVPRQSQIQLPHDVHFTPQGSEILARAVAKSIRSALVSSRLSSATD